MRFGAGAGQEGLGLGSYGCRGWEGWGVMVDFGLLGMNMWKRDGYSSRGKCIKDCIDNVSKKAQKRSILDVLFLCLP